MKYRANKKIHYLITLVVISLVGLAFFSEANVVRAYGNEKITDDGFKYDVRIRGTEYDGTLSITGYVGNETHVVIPSEIDGVAVTELYVSAFANHPEIESIVIPIGVNCFDETAFYGCANLKIISLPEGVKEIGRGTFQNCNGLKEVHLPESLSWIGNSTFQGCTSLEEIVIPDGVKRIDDYAFGNCSNLKKVILPKEIEDIAVDAFIGCDSLILYCYAGSYAETYAINHEIRYQLIQSGDSEENVVSISVQDAVIKTGEKVTVNVDIENNPGVMGAVLEIEYDDGLELIDAVSGSAFSSLTMTRPGSFHSPSKFVWDAQELSDSDIKDGSVLTLTFQVSESVESRTQLGVRITYVSGDIVDRNLRPVNASLSNGIITVIPFRYGDLNDDGDVNATDIVLMRRHIAGGYDQTIILDAANINEDDHVNATDVILLRRYIAGGYGMDILPVTGDSGETNIAWSEWQETPVYETEAVDVEKKKQYSKRIVTERTVREFGEWTEYTDMELMPDDNSVIETLDLNYYDVMRIRYDGYEKKLIQNEIDEFTVNIVYTDLCTVMSEEEADAAVEFIFQHQYDKLVEDPDKEVHTDSEICKICMDKGIKLYYEEACLATEASMDDAGNGVQVSTDSVGQVCLDNLHGERWYPKGDNYKTPKRLYRRRDVSSTKSDKYSIDSYCYDVTRIRYEGHESSNVWRNIDMTVLSTVYKDLKNNTNMSTAEINEITGIINNAINGNISYSECCYLCQEKGVNLFYEEEVLVTSSLSDDAGDGVQIVTDANGFYYQNLLGETWYPREGSLRTRKTEYYGLDIKESKTTIRSEWTEYSDGVISESTQQTENYVDNDKRYVEYENIEVKTRTMYRWRNKKK